MIYSDDFFSIFVIILMHNAFQDNSGIVSL